MKTSLHNARARRTTLRQSAVEPLERRTLLSGNVLATQSGDRLNLNGDELGNEIMVRSGNDPTEIIVQSMDQTTVNGSQQPVVFEGVQSIDAFMGGGDDWFKTADLTILSTSPGGILVDGGWGDDRIEFKNTTLHGGQSAGIQVYGDLNLFQPDPAPNSGNDTIELANTTFIADGPDALGTGIDIFGEFTTGGEITGGNDTIRVTDTLLQATSGADTFISNLLDIAGDFIFVFDSDASIAGGNDDIAVTNTTLESNGATFDSGSVDIIGDDVFVPDGAVAGLIGGGNDSISVDNFDVTAAGGRRANGTVMRVFGDITENQSQSAQSRAEIGGGNDDITFSNVLLAADPTDPSVANVLIFGESQPVAFNPSPGTSVVGQGNDDVALQNVDLSARFSSITIDTALGDDTLDVLNSSFAEFNATLGDGNDYAKLNNDNIFAEAHVDGGPGYDVLSAHNNDGVLTYSNFEEANVT